MKKEDLLYLSACWNGDPFLVETDEEMSEIWDEICENGYHEIEKDTDKDLPWRVATLTDMSLLNGSPDK